ncbi:hypothetical protein MRX96_021321 [Rhipicephalus microplus]
MQPCFLLFQYLSEKPELERIHQEVHHVRSTTEGKVDKQIMKSLVLGYFSSPQGQRPEVVRLLARVLDFSRDEMDKAGISLGLLTGSPSRHCSSSSYKKSRSLRKKCAFLLRPWPLGTVSRLPAIKAAAPTTTPPPQQHLLLQPISESLPTLAPVTPNEPRDSTAFLQEMLS